MHTHTYTHMHARTVSKYTRFSLEKNKSSKFACMGNINLMFLFIFSHHGSMERLAPLSDAVVLLRAARSPIQLFYPGQILGPGDFL